jgi:hypothetical protein
MKKPIFGGLAFSKYLQSFQLSSNIIVANPISISKLAVLPITLAGHALSGITTHRQIILKPLEWKFKGGYLRDQFYREVCRG